jgi:hypothetical protein
MLHSEVSLIALIESDFKDEIDPYSLKTPPVRNTRY